jgi:hypothetical protein
VGLRYQWTIAGSRPLNILQGIGNGCAFLDYDADGNLDILLVGAPPALFRGDGKGHFRDVTQATGLAGMRGHFLGCASGDYDNDGFDDLYLSAYRGGALLHNEGGRRFRDVTRGAGLAPQPWGSSCSFVDADGDGRLDLYVGNYVRFGPETQPQLCDVHGTFTACGPGEYGAERGALYRNLGGGRFADVTRTWGLNQVSGKTLGVAAAPLGAGGTALAVANDQVPGDLLLLRGKASEDRGKVSGMAYAADGRVYGGMGIDWGDYDNDGRLDLVIATFQNQAKPVFHNEGSTFAPQDSARLGMTSSIPFVAFGVRWLDYDNDGWLDLLFTNGHVQDNIADADLMSGPAGGAVYRQPIVLYRNLQGMRFADMSDRLGSAGRPIVGRGLAVGDYDNDGRLDALAVDAEGRPVLMHNVMPGAGNWLQVNLEGRGSNRDGYGALVILEAGGLHLTRHCHADGSYLSSSDRRVHFGLGEAHAVDRLQVRWPGGGIDTYRHLPVNRILTLREDAVRGAG